MKKQALLTLLAILTLVGAPAIAKNIQDYISDIPGIGLISDEIDFDGVKLQNLSFVKEKDVVKDVVVKDKYVITTPGRKHQVKVHYQVDSRKLKDMRMHHLIYGLDKAGPQDCFLHSLGELDRDGDATFTVTAPDKPGVYQLRFCHAEGYGTFSSVKDNWYNDKKATSSTIMGIIAVVDK